MVYTDIFILYQPGEKHIDQKRRVTDFIWSKNTYRLNQIVQESGNRVLYYLQDGSDRAFVREKLMHISEDTKVPPDWVSEWKQSCIIFVTPWQVSKNIVLAGRE